MRKRITELWGSVFDEDLFVRSIYSEMLLEDFFVSAIASLLIIRLFLSLTGYPTLGGEDFHIAHMLFGGLFMLIAMIILLGFSNHAAHEIGAGIGGIGFGTFIDELGKFITNDNNYFYQPAVALIYVIFVLLYLAIRRINRQRALSKEEALVNAFEIAKQASLEHLDVRVQNLMGRLLDLSDQDNPLTQNLRDMLPHINTVPSHRLSILARGKQWIDKLYQFIASRWWFTPAITTFFILTSGLTLYSIVALISWSWVLIIWMITGILILIVLTKSRNRNPAYPEIIISIGIIGIAIFIAWVVLANLKTSPASFIDYIQLISSNITAVLILIGISRLPRFRLGAYVMFRRAILISIFITRVFAFYEFQFFALTGLGVDIIVLVALRYMIQQEFLKRGL